MATNSPVYSNSGGAGKAYGKKTCGKLLFIFGVKHLVRIALAVVLAVVVAGCAVEEQDSLTARSTPAVTATSVATSPPETPTPAPTFSGLKSFDSTPDSDPDPDSPANTPTPEAPAPQTPETTTPAPETPAPTSTPVEPATNDQWVPLSQFLTQVTISAERPAGYDRDDWRHWVDADRDGLDTRQEVLAAESLNTPTVTNGRVQTGSWDSIYDDATTTTPRSFDVDHVVALAEAHQSGGWAWDALTRQLYANDLTFPDHLVAVSASSNRSKGARDPAEWLPPNRNQLCTYLAWWTIVKVRWQLSMDQAEYNTIANHASNSCANTLIDLDAALRGSLAVAPG